MIVSFRQGDLAGHWWIWVNGNWRVTFRFVDSDVVMKSPVHPGEILREDVLAALGLSVGEAASRLGISRVTLSRVLHGHARISPNLAVQVATTSQQNGQPACRRSGGLTTSP